MKYNNILEEIIKLDFKEVEIINFEKKDNNLIFTVRWKRKKYKCPCCWKATKNKQDLSLYQWKPIKHLVLSDNRLIQIATQKRYFKCKNCNRNFLEHFDFEAESWLHTKTFESFVISAWWYMSWCQIARNTNTSYSKIHKILSNIDPAWLNNRWIQIMEKLEEIFLWIDEHSFRWKDMVLVITELREKEVLAILPWITNNIFIQWLNSLPEHIRIKIKWFSSDMNKWYRNTIQKHLWKKVYTVDKYHLVQEVNNMMTDVLSLNRWLIKMNFIKADDIVKKWKVPKDIIIKIKKKIKKWYKKQFSKYKNKIDNMLKPEHIEKDKLYNSKWVKIYFKEITLEYFLNGRWTYKSLFTIREKNMSWYQKLRLRQITREFDYNNYLKEAWVIKENFVDALDEKDINWIDRIMSEALSSEHYRIQEFWRTLRNWHDGIKNYCLYSTDEFKFTNAFTESINNQCKVAKKVSHWFKHKDNYFRKLTSRFSIQKSQK